MESIDVKNLFLFRGMENYVDDIMSATPHSVASFSAGEEICTRENFRKGLSFVLSGEAAVLRHSDSETGRVRLNRLHPGDSFGASVLFCEQDEFPTDLIAVKKTRVLFIPQKNVEELLGRYPKAALNYIRFLSGRIRFLNQKVDSFSGRTAEAKIAAFLLQKENNRALRIDNYKNVAESLSLGRATLYRVLDAFSEQSLLIRDGKSVTLLDIEKLERISHS